MTMMAAVKTCFRKYATFSGRARRAEYWWFTLFNFLVSLALGLFEEAVFGAVQPLSSLYSLVVLVPGLAVGARRLHDIGKSGWWQLLWFVPIIGWVILIWWLATLGDEGANEYGDDPLAA